MLTGMARAVSRPIGGTKAPVPTNTGVYPYTHRRGGRSVARKSKDKREARARVDEWYRALRIIQAWVQSARAIESKELSQAISAALDVATEGYNRALAESRAMDRSAE